MPIQPGVWGIDLGQCGLKAIRLQEIEGQILATAFDYVEHPKILSQPDADPDQLTREALDKFLSRNTLRGDIVAISVPGQSGLARFVKLPPVEEKKIADIVRFEAKQQIPFNLDEVVWDYQKIGSGVVTDGFAMETEIGLFAMKRDMVNRYLQHFKDVGVDVHLVQMAPLALCNFVAYDLLAKEPVGGEAGETAPAKNCIVALDIGADSSNLVITDGERIIWQRPIPLGGNHFTRALTKDLKLTFAKAEHLKRNATKSPDLKKILAALKPVLNDFVGEVQRSLGYFTNTHRDAHIEYMVGLGNAFRLPGLQKFLGEKLQLDVRKLAKMERMTGDQVVAQQVYTENVLTYAVAYGLALQGLKRARLLTNLLPGEIRVERLVKAKKPFAVAAAAALLLGIGGLALSYGLEYRTYNDKRVTDAMAASKSAADRAEAANRKFEDTKKKAKDEEEAVKTIVAGQPERDNWLQLHKFIATAVPQPDGQPRQLVVILPDGKKQSLEIPNIPERFTEQYWSKPPDKAGHPNPKDAMSGADAFKEYLKRTFAGGIPSGKDGASDELGSGIDDLVQFNIESVDSFFCDNLGAYWKQVRSKVTEDGAIRPQSDADPKKAPQEYGWVVEIQGYTLHHGAEAFIRNTLLENIARLGIQRPKEEAPAAAPGAPPAPAAVPAPPPVAGQPPEGEQKLPEMGPVVNHISHVVLYQSQHSPSNGPLEIIGSGRGVVRSLAGGGLGTSGPAGPEFMIGEKRGAFPGGGPGAISAAGPGAAPGASAEGGADRPAPTGPPRSSWLGLPSRAGGTAGAPGMMPGERGLPGPAIPGKLPRPPRGPVPAAPGPVLPGDTKPPSTPATTQGAHTRTEFIILFIWKEPTPSDLLRGQTPPGADSSAGVGQTSSPQPGFPQAPPAFVPGAPGPRAN